MSFLAIATTAVSVGGTLLATGSRNRAADRASDAQAQAADRSVEEQRRQFDATKELLSPYVESGSSGLDGLMALSGLSGDEAQAAEIARIERSPEFTARVEAGEAAILSNASATGGLRGGNTQAALAQFRPQMLADQINTQYGRYGGIADRGQNSATQTGYAGQNFANQASNAYTQQGSAIAGAALARGENSADLINSIGGLANDFIKGF